MSRGLLLPDGEIGHAGRGEAGSGYVPSWIETFSSRAVKLRPLLVGTFHVEYCHREGDYNISR